MFEAQHVCLEPIGLFPYEVIQGHDKKYAGNSDKC